MIGSRYSVAKWWGDKYLNAFWFLKWPETSNKYRHMASHVLPLRSRSTVQIITLFDWSLMANVWMRLNCLKTPKCLLLCVCFQMPSITFPHRMTEAESTVAQRLLCTILILSGSNNNLQRPVNCPGEYLFVQTSVYQTITCILNEEAQWVEVYCSLRRSQVCSVRNFDTHTHIHGCVCVSVVYRWLKCLLTFY